MKHRLKPDTGKKEWLDWSKQLISREPEVLATLRQEGVRLEACFLSEDEEYIYYFLEVEDLKKAYEVFAQSKLPVDREHEKIKDSALEGGISLKNLFVFRNPG